MSSILTNTSAMTALQTLRSINTNLSKAQDEISTGKTIATSKDNAAVWAISKVMESDVSGINAIKSSLNLGESTVSVARKAAEDVVDDLTKMQELVISAQSESVDKTTLQTQITNLVEGIKQTIGSAQFNGLNLLDGSNAGASVNVLAALNRDLAGNVSTSTIGIDRKNLASDAGVIKAAFTGSDGATAAANTFAFGLDAAGGTTTNGIVIDNTTNPLAAGDSISVTIGDKTATYTVTAEDVAATTPADMIAVGLKNKIDALGIDGLTVDYDSASAGTLSLTNNNATEDLSVTGQFTSAGSGGLAAMSSIDVVNDAASAMSAMTDILKTANDAAAYYGAMESRLNSQSSFLSTLADAMTTGIGSLVDADMEEASARLTALQTQQQLGIQALSIANQTPQTILSLFQ